MPHTLVEKILLDHTDAEDVRPGDVVTAEHAVMGYKFPRLLAVLLDSPAHMTR